jgi:hypothetical protein
VDEVFIGSEVLAGSVLSRGRLRWNWLWSGRRGVIAGVAAAALHGARWVDESLDVELIWRCGRPPQGIVVRNERVETDEIVEIAGLPVTTPARQASRLRMCCRCSIAIAEHEGCAALLRRSA